MGKIQYSNQLKDQFLPNPLKRALNCVADCVTKSKPGDWVLDEQFITCISSLTSDEMRRLAHLIDSNCLTIPVCEALGNFDSSASWKLKACLEPMALSLRELKTHRDTLLRRVADVLDYAGVDYAVFKTLNRLNWVGVDIDVIINPSNYSKGVKALLANSFFSIDDLSKKYATGFMIKNNPIIIDLHTELAVLGVPYMSSGPLLERKRELKVPLLEGSELVSLNILDETMDALVRMVHCVLKEGIIKISDVAEVHYILPRKVDLITSYVKEEDLQLAISIFSYVALHTLRAEQFAHLIIFDDGFNHGLSRKILANSIHDSVPPLKLPVVICMIAFLDRLKRKGEIGRYMSLPLRSLKFKKNVERLGQKMLERLKHQSAVL